MNEAKGGSGAGLAAMIIGGLAAAGGIAAVAFGSKKPKPKFNGFGAFGRSPLARPPLRPAKKPCGCGR
jgi:hypothetical protein